MKAIGAVYLAEWFIYRFISKQDSGCFQEKQSCKQVWLSLPPDDKQLDLKPTALRI